MISPEMVSNLKTMAAHYRERHRLPATERVTLALPDHYFPVDQAIRAVLESANVMVGRSSELGLSLPIERGTSETK